MSLYEPVKARTGSALEFIHIQEYLRMFKKYLRIKEYIRTSKEI